MKTKILYSTKCTITIHFCEGHELASADWREQFCSLQDALDTADFILDSFYPNSANEIIIWDSNTGEILAECRKDDPTEDEEEENDYGDWDYNEDLGFDPYMGCYSDDC